MNLLLAEDDDLLADALQQHLRNAGYRVTHAPNGAVADYLLARDAFDIAVLDIGMPMLDGLSVLKALRSRQQAVPVLLLTARDALHDRVGGLQLGADDYVTKPFDMPELLARLQALLRRTQPTSRALQLRGLTLDAQRRSADVGGVALELSGREWSLLSLLVQQSEHVVTKEQITQAWQNEGGEAGAGNVIEVYIHRLRRKLQGSGLLIRTVRGLGYLLEDAAVA